MKRLTVLLMVLIMLFLSEGSISAFAEEKSYARILKEDAGFYRSTDFSSPVFYLPYTYYVKVLEKNDYYAHVECYGSGSATTCIDGYVKTEDLFFDGTTPQYPYLNLKITTATETGLFSGIDNYEKLQNLFSGRQLSYYGYLIDATGNYWYYVEYGEKLGYVKETDVVPFTMVNHTYPLPLPPEPIPGPDDETTPSPEDPRESFSVSIQTIIIICLCLAVLVILLLIFKPAKKPVAASYYDENDYE